MTLCQKMKELTHQVARRIASASVPFAADYDSLLIAHEIIAKVRLEGFMAFDHRIDVGGFEDDDVAALRDALLTYIRTYPEDPSRGAAYWGLAALHDAKELDLLRDLLQIESSREIIEEHVLWQIMIALDNIGEDILDPIHTDPVQQGGDRWAASKLYLARHT